MDDDKYKVCVCEHFDCYHEGFFWFHMTACKIDNCPCQKFRLLGKFTFKDAPIKAQKELAV